MITVNTFEDPKKLGLVLVRDPNRNGYSYKLIKNVPGEYVLDNTAQYFHRVPRGMLYVKELGDGDSEEYVSKPVCVDFCFVGGGFPTFSAAGPPVNTVILLKQMMRMSAGVVVILNQDGLLLDNWTEAASDGCRRIEWRRYLNE